MSGGSLIPTFCFFTKVLVLVDEVDVFFRAGFVPELTVRDLSGLVPEFFILVFIVAVLASLLCLADTIVVELPLVVEVSISVLEEPVLLSFPPTPR